MSLKEKLLAAEENAAKEEMKRVPFGAHIFKPTFELVTTKGGDPMIAILFVKDEEHYPVREYLAFKEKPTKLKKKPDEKIARTSNDLSIDKGVNILKRCYKRSVLADLPDGCESWDHNDTCKWFYDILKEYENKPCQIVIKHKEEEYQKTNDDGSQTNKRVIKAEPWKYGTVKEKIEFDQSSAFIPLPTTTSVLQPVLNEEDTADWDD